jgi:hypothetical protein
VRIPRIYFSSFLAQLLRSPENHLVSIDAGRDTPRCRQELPHISIRKHRRTRLHQRALPEASLRPREISEVDRENLHGMLLDGIFSSILLVSHIFCSIFIS